MTLPGKMKIKRAAEPPSSEMILPIVGTRRAMTTVMANRTTVMI